MDALVFALQHCSFGDEHVDVCCIFLQRWNQSFAHIAMLTVISHVPDALAVCFDEEHVGVIDAMAVEERRYLDVANANAYWGLA